MAGIFEQELSGGHPNSLGNTVKVVAQVLKDQELLSELFLCYSSPDEVVRLRTSNAFKRIFREKPAWFRPMVPKFLRKILQLDQASAMWTFSQLCLECEEQLSATQKKKATEIIKRFLEKTDDWIVLNTSLQTLGAWSLDDAQLKQWLIPRLKKLSRDERKSVAKRAQKLSAKLS